MTRCSVARRQCAHHPQHRLPGQVQRRLALCLISACRCGNFTPDKFEDYGAVSFLKGGIAYADVVNTVSPTYASETRTPAARLWAWRPISTTRAPTTSASSTASITRSGTRRVDPLIPARLFRRPIIAGKASVQTAELQRREPNAAKNWLRAADSAGHRWLKPSADTQSALKRTGIRDSNRALAGFPCQPGVSTPGIERFSAPF
jgi:hypothetical protein